MNRGRKLCRMNRSMRLIRSTALYCGDMRVNRYDECVIGYKRTKVPAFMGNFCPFCISVIYDTLS